jgi:hypothetical protein
MEIRTLQLACLLLVKQPFFISQTFEIESKVPNPVLG